MIHRQLSGTRLKVNENPAIFIHCQAGTKELCVLLHDLLLYVAVSKRAGLSAALIVLTIPLIKFKYCTLQARPQSLVWLLVSRVSTGGLL